MKTVEIKGRWTSVLYATKVADDDPCPIRTTLEKAVADGVSLIGANLSGANLAGANLRSANLVDADLTNANLSSAYLVDANLFSADLTGANLRGADLYGANLSGAYLCFADLTGADLIDACLTGMDLTGVKLSGVNLCGARYEDAPVVPKLDAQILERIESGQGELDMGTWHTCETTHCRAGWAVTLAGEAGRTLEAKIGTAAAGALIYHRSTGRVPDFYASDEDALADIVACARCP
jgi:hypothetical protein